MEKQTSDAENAAVPKKSDSKEVQIEEFREVLIWPLALSYQDSQSYSAEIGSLAAAIEKQGEDAVNGPWKRVIDPLQYLDPQDGAGVAGSSQSAGAYAEFVYFHGYVQRFLYQHQGKSRTHQGGPKSDLPFHLFSRTDIKGVEVVIDKTCYRLKVERLHLYLFAIGTAALVVEISSRRAKAGGDTGQPGTSSQDLSLHDVLLLQDRFRRCYPPYWTSDLAPGQVPARVTWLDAKEKAIIGHCYGSDNAQDEFVRLDRGAADSGMRQAPVFAFWRDLLPLKLDGYEDPGKAGQLQWSHVVDERMPIMSYVSLAGERKEGDITGPLDAVSDGDLMRLCFADSPGNSQALPYDAEFLAHFDETHCYNRFKDAGTVHMFSGYSYVVIGDSWHFKNLMREHFRRHYFQMFLLHHFEFAALLMYSNWISEVVARFGVGREEEQTAFERAMLDIEGQVLAFTHRYRFTGLSNQVQAIEMQDIWRRQLRLDGLYRDLQEELKSATGYIFSQDQARQTLTGNRLAGIATIVATLGLPMAFLGMNIISEGKFIFDWPIQPGQTYFALNILVAIISMIFTRGTTAPSSRMTRTEKAVTGVLCLIIIFSLFGLLLL